MKKRYASVARKGFGERDSKQYIFTCIEHAAKGRVDVAHDVLRSRPQWQRRTAED